MTKLLDPHRVIEGIYTTHEGLGDLDWDAGEAALLHAHVAVVEDVRERLLSFVVEHGRGIDVVATVYPPTRAPVRIHITDPLTGRAYTRDEVLAQWRHALELAGEEVYEAAAA